MRRYVRSAPLSQPPVISLWSKNNDDDDVSRPVKKKYKRTNRRVCRNSITIAREHRVVRDRGTETTTRRLVSRAPCVCHCYDDLVSAAVWRAWWGRYLVGQCKTRSIDKKTIDVSCKNMERTPKADF